MTVNRESSPDKDLSVKSRKELLEIISDLESRLIVNRKHYEELEQAGGNFRNLFAAIDDLVFVLDLSGNIIISNEAVFARLGYSAEEVKGNPFFMIYPEELHSDAERILKGAISGSNELSTIPLLTKQGDFLPASTKAKQGLWDGQPAVFVVCKDVLKIKQSEEKFSTAFHRSPTVMVIGRFDDTRLLDVNETFLRTFGYSRKDVIGKPIGELSLKIDPEVGNGIRRKILLNEPVRDLEATITTDSGRELTFLYSADYIYIGNDLCFMVTGIDITLRKQAEADLLQARNEAEKANHAKSDFISRMSHELRTPMNSILGFAQLMSMGEITPAQKKSINHILNSGRHLLSLINEVLEISRIESGRFELSPEPVQLEGIIREMTDIISPVAGRRKIKTELEYSASNSLYVFADRQSLKQVLLNLINNAVKYNREGGSVIIKTRLLKGKTGQETGVRISVNDTGHGIKPENIGKLFSPFERIGAENTEIEGSGLGLSLVKRFVTSMNGDVGVASIHGEGSTFWIDLPLAPGDTGGIEVKGEVFREGLIVNEVSGTILYLEDKKSNIDLAEEVLYNKWPSVQIISCMYGAKAVATARLYKPDLILLDLNLPDLHGTTVLRRLKSDNNTVDIPVIIISADVRTHQIKSLLESGANDYLTQPLDLNLFISTIDKYMGHKNK